MGSGRGARSSGSNRAGFTPLAIAVVAPHADAYSETFIRSQVEGLQGKVEFLYGGYLPTLSAGGLPPTYPLVRALCRAVAPLTSRSPSDIGSFAVRTLPGLSAREGVSRYLRSADFDVVLAQYGPTGVEMMEPCQRAAVPLVVHFHGYDAYEKEILERHETTYPDLFARASALIAVSTDMARQLESLGAPPEKIHLRPYGVDTRRFSPPDVRSGDPVVLSVGRFVDKKAPHLTILAFREALQSAPSAELHMIGDGPLLDACRILVRALGLTESVRFHGALAHDEVVSWMRGATCYVQHSVVPPSGDSEGTPVSVLEAAASGLPVVATRHAGIADVIRDGESGFLVEEGDVRSMGSALARILVDPEAAAEMGKAARRRIERDYDRVDAIRGLQAIVETAARPASG